MGKGDYFWFLKKCFLRWRWGRWVKYGKYEKYAHRKAWLVFVTDLFHISTQPFLVIFLGKWWLTCIELLLTVVKLNYWLIGFSSQITKHNWDTTIHLEQLKSDESNGRGTHPLSRNFSGARLLLKWGGITPVMSHLY